MNICIVSTPRAGTTYLAKLLQQSPAISEYIDEPFNQDNITTDYTLGCEEQLHKIQSLAVQGNLLIKDNEHTRIPSLHPDNIKLQRIIREYELLLREKFYLIKLTRDNLFEQTLSSCIAPLNDIWVRDSNTLPPDKVTVDVDNFKNLYFEFKRKQELLNAYPGCNETIRYEDITGNSREDWNLIKGVVPPKEHVIINNLRNYDKNLVVDNYEEIVETYKAIS